MALDMQDFAPPIHVGPPVASTGRLVLAAIGAYTAEHGFPPTQREIGNLVGIPSLGHVHWWLAQLREFGYLDYACGKARTIRLTRLALPAAGGGA